MGLLVTALVLPIFFYFLAHKMPNKKYLTAYAFFWLTVIAFAIYDLIVATNSSNGNDDLSLGWVLIAGFLYFSCIVAIIGIIGRAIILHSRHRGKEIKISTVHIASFCSLFILPTVVQLLMVSIGVISMLPMFLRLSIAKIIQIVTSILFG